MVFQQALTLHTRGHRHMQDLTEAVSGIVGQSGVRTGLVQVFNVGSTREITIKDLAARTIRRLGSDSKIRFVRYEDVFGDGFEDMMKRVPSLDKVKSVLGWEPGLDIDAIIDDIANHLRSGDKGSATA